MAPPAAGGISSWLAQPFPPTAAVAQSEPGSLLEQQPLCVESHVPTAKRPTWPRAGSLQGVGWTAWGDYGLTLFFRLPPVPCQVLAFAEPGEKVCRKDLGSV